MSEIVSSCCSAAINTDIGICSSCGEHAGLVCIECDWEFSPDERHDCDDPKQKGKDACDPR